jgi:hypothetical protein
MLLTFTLQVQVQVQAQVQINVNCFALLSLLNRRSKKPDLVAQSVAQVSTRKANPLIGLVGRAGLEPATRPL